MARLRLCSILLALGLALVAGPAVAVTIVTGGVTEVSSLGATFCPEVQTFAGENQSGSISTCDSSASFSLNVSNLSISLSGSGSAGGPMDVAITNSSSHGALGGSMILFTAQDGETLTYTGFQPFTGGSHQSEVLFYDGSTGSFSGAAVGTVFNLVSGVTYGVRFRFSTSGGAGDFGFDMAFTNVPEPGTALLLGLGLAGLGASRKALGA